MTYLKIESPKDRGSQILFNADRYFEAAQTRARQEVTQAEKRMASKRHGEPTRAKSAGVKGKHVAGR